MADIRNQGKQIYLKLMKLFEACYISLWLALEKSRKSIVSKLYAIWREFYSFYAGKTEKTVSVCLSYYKYLFFPVKPVTKSVRSRPAQSNRVDVFCPTGSWLKWVNAAYMNITALSQDSWLCNANGISS